MKTTPFQGLVQYLEKLQTYAVAENGYRRVMMDKFVGKAQVYVAQLEVENERLKRRDEFLSALEQAGVNNWSGYSIAFEILETK